MQTGTTRVKFRDAPRKLDVVSVEGDVSDALVYLRVMDSRFGSEGSDGEGCRSPGRAAQKQEPFTLQGGCHRRRRGVWAALELRARATWHLIRRYYQSAVVCPLGGVTRYLIIAFT